jgi:tetratricopeptide (TPR) repeat protein
MPDSTPKDLRHAENLRREGKFQEALDLISDIEKKGTLTPGDKLSLLISKGKIYVLTQQYQEAVRIGELAYRLSKGLEGVPDTIIALILKANVIFISQNSKQVEKVLDYLNEAEELLNSLNDLSPTFIFRQKTNILFRKAWVYNQRGELDIALETARECLEIQEKFNRKSDIAYTYYLIGNIYFRKGESDVALDYFMKSVKIFEEIGDQFGNSWNFALIGRISFSKGDLNKALTYCKKSLSTKLIIDYTKLENYEIMGHICDTKGELDKALRYYKQGSSLAEKLNYYYFLIEFNIAIGRIYIKKREYELAIEFLKSGLMMAKEDNYIFHITTSLLSLGWVYVLTDSWEEAQQNVEQLKNHSEKHKNDYALSAYRLRKAVLLKKSRRSHNRAEAEKLLKVVIKEESFFLANRAMVVLCEFYLEELYFFNEPEILEELNPLITQLLKFAKEQNSYGTLAEVKLLQAKLALIQLEFEEAERLLTQAQHIADLYGLNLIAQLISSEHDKILEQTKIWEDLKERDAPMTERLKLVSVDQVIERLQGTRAIKKPELENEEPILLLIMDKSGITYFNYSFKENWDFEPVFSSFMSVFDSFSSEVFSESIDRIKIGENLILINPVESFLVCYVIKGQSYLGLQKLNRFSNNIKENTEIWESLNKAVKTGEVLDLDKPQSLGNVVNEIFISKLSAVH